MMALMLNSWIYKEILVYLHDVYMKVVCDPEVIVLRHLLFMSRLRKFTPNSDFRCDMVPSYEYTITDRYKVIAIYDTVSIL